MQMHLHFPEKGRFDFAGDIVKAKGKELSLDIVNEEYAHKDDPEESNSRKIKFGGEAC